MSKRVILGCLMAMAVGCNNNPTTTPGNDAGGGTDGGTETDGGGPGDDAGAPPRPALTVVAPNTLDLSCVGTATQPAGTGDVSAQIVLTEYVSRAAVGTTNLEIYTDDAITGTCAGNANCVMGMTDAAGHATVMAPGGGWIGLHIPAGQSGSAEVLAYNQTWPTTAGADFPTYAFSTTSINLVASLLGRQLQTATAGAISGQVNDCMGHNVQNAHPRVFHGTEEITTGTGNTSPRITGLENTSPTRGPFFLTGSGGTFVGANVPAGDDYHVEIWGTTTAGGTEELIGCEEGRVVAGAITVLVIGPLRSDYPAGSACAMAAAANP